MFLLPSSTVMVFAIGVNLLSTLDAAEAGCTFDASLEGQTWWRGYERHSPLPLPAYRYDVFSSALVRTYTYPNTTPPVEVWHCKDLRTETVGHVTHYYSVLYNTARRQYECRQYTPVPPGVMLVKRRPTPGAFMPRLDNCVDILRRLSVVEVMVVYVSGLVAAAPCPWSPGVYSVKARFEESPGHVQQCPVGRATIRGSKVSGRGCARHSTHGHPFSSSLFCVSSWLRTTVHPLVTSSDGYVLLYSYNLSSSIYYFYVARYSVTVDGQLTVSLKSSPETGVTFNTQTRPDIIDFRHSLLVYTPMTQASIRKLPRPASENTHWSTTREPDGPGRPREPDRHATLRGEWTTRTTTLWWIGSTSTYTGKKQTAPPGVPCRLLPCLNGGKCLPRGNACLCWPGTTGFRCEKVTKVVSASPLPVVVPLSRIPHRPSALSTSKSSLSPHSSQPSSARTRPPPPAAGLDIDPVQARHLLVSLVSLTAGFSLLSAALCCVVCCRRAQPLLVEDQKVLIPDAASSGGVPSGATPPYVATYNSSKTAQAWHPDYKTGPRAGGRTTPRSKVLPRFPARVEPEVARPSTPSSHLRPVGSMRSGTARSGRQTPTTAL